MNFIKKIDYFRKYTSDDMQQTFCGACLSIVSLLIVILFAFSEFRIILQPTLNREVTIMKSESSILAEMGSSNNVPINIDLIIKNTPCEAIFLKQFEIFGQRSVDPRFLDGFWLHRINKENQEIAEDYINPEIEREHSKFGPHLQRLLTQVQDNEGCHIFGQLMTNKSPGTLMIFVNWDTEEMEIINRLVQNLKTRITMDHKLLHYSFGEKSVQTEVIQKFANESGVVKFSKADEIPEFSGVKSCEYFAKIIPHKFYVSGSKIDKEAFQYSIHYQCTEENEGNKAGHMLSFMHEISPLGIKYSITKPPFMMALVSIVSVIGGIYVIMNILNGFLVK